MVGHQAGEKFPKVNNEFKKIFVVIEINMSFWFGKAYKYFWLKTKRLTSYFPRRQRKGLFYI